MKKLIAILLTALGCVAVQAQTTTNTTFTVWQNLFGLYNTNLEAFTNSFQVDFKFGLSMQTSGQSGLQQEIEPSIWKHIAGTGGDNGNILIGGGVNIDTLGQTGGQGLDGAGAHLYLEYAKYNLGAYMGAGWFKDIDRQQQFLEFPLGVEVRITKAMGLFASYNVGVNLNNAKSDTSIQGRSVAGASIDF